MNSYRRCHDFWASLVSDSLFASMPFATHVSGWRKVMRPFLTPDALDKWLLETAENAEMVFCPNAHHCPCCCCLDVVRTEGGIYARCPEGKMADLMLAPCDVAIKRYDIQRLHAELFALIPRAAPRPEVSPELPLTWLLGCLLRESDSKTRNIFISYLTPPQLQMQISVLFAVSDKQPFILLSPFAECFLEETSLVFLKLGIELVSLRKHFAVNMWSGMPELLSVPEPVEGFLKRVSEKAPLGIPVPPGIVWEQIHICFLDGMTVNCLLRGKNYTRSFIDLGMSDTRTGKPDSSWALLQVFSINSGMIPIDVSNRNKSDRLKQQKYRLDMAMRHYFGMKASAIVFSPDHTAYVCRFAIKSDAHSSIYHRKK